MRAGRLPVAMLLVASAACGDDLAPGDAGATTGERIVRVGDVEITLDLSGTTPYPGPCTARTLDPELIAQCTYAYGEADRLASIEYTDRRDLGEVTTDRLAFTWYDDDLAAIDIALSGMGCTAGTWTFTDNGSILEIGDISENNCDADPDVLWRSTFGPGALGSLEPLDCSRLLATDGDQQVLMTGTAIGDGPFQTTIEYSYDAEPGPGVTRTRIADHSDYDAPDGRDGITVFTYDDAGRLVERVEDEIPADGQDRITTYAYDGDRLVEVDEVQYDDTKFVDVEYVYNAGGNLVGTIVGEPEGDAGPRDEVSLTLYDYSCWDSR